VGALLSLATPTSLTPMVTLSMGAKLGVLLYRVERVLHVILPLLVGALLSLATSTSLISTIMLLMDAKWAVLTYPLHHVSRALLILPVGAHNCLRVRSTSSMPTKMPRMVAKLMFARKRPKHFVILAMVQKQSSVPTNVRLNLVSKPKMNPLVAGQMQNVAR